MKYKKNILIVAAHPDDDVLGCGGTISKHVKNGDIVHTLFLSDGVTSRLNFGSKNNVDVRTNFAINASRLLGSEDPTFIGFPDNMMDTVPLLKIVQAIESHISMIEPVVVYTHYSDDLNVDHQITHKAVMTACRPKPNFCVKKILSFEVLSSSEWSIGCNSFKPNYFVDISDTIKEKISAFKEYKTEILSFPNSRSIESIKALGIMRGGSVGMSVAEGFMVERILL